MSMMYIAVKTEITNSILYKVSISYRKGNLDADHLVYPRNFLLLIFVIFQVSPSCPHFLKALVILYISNKDVNGVDVSVCKS